MDPDPFELRNLVKEFPGQRAVDDVSLDDSARRILLAAGTLGLRQDHDPAPDRRLRSSPRPATCCSRAKSSTTAPYERNVSTVFQNYALFPHLTARENIEFGLRRQRRRRTSTGASAKCSNSSASPARRSRVPRSFPAASGSAWRWRARWCCEPDVLLLDEPLAALDPKLRKQMRVELKALQRRVGITFLLVTHDQEEALSMSDQHRGDERGPHRAGGHAGGRLPAAARRASSPGSWAR